MLRSSLLRKQFAHQKTFVNEYMQKHLGEEGATAFQQHLDNKLREEPNPLIKLTEELANTQQKPGWLDLPYSLYVFRQIVCWLEELLDNSDTLIQWVTTLPSKTTKEDLQSFFFWKTVNHHDALTAAHFNKLDKAQQDQFTAFKNELILDQNKRSKEFLFTYLQKDEAEALQGELAKKELYEQRKLLNEKINALPNKTEVTRFLTEINKESLLHQRAFLEDHLKSLPENGQQTVKKLFDDAISAEIARFAKEYVETKPGQTKEAQLEQWLNGKLISHKASYLIQQMAPVLPDAQKKALPKDFYNAMVNFEAAQIALMRQRIQNSLAHQQRNFPHQALWGSTLALLATPIAQAYGFGPLATVAAVGALKWNQISTYSASFAAQKIASPRSFLHPWVYSIFSGAFYGLCPPVSVNSEAASVSWLNGRKALWTENFEASLNKSAVVVTPKEGFYNVPSSNNNVQMCTNEKTQIGVGTQGNIGSIFWGPAMKDEAGLAFTPTNGTALATRASCEQIVVHAPTDYSTPTSMDETAVAIRFPSPTHNNP